MSLSGNDQLFYASLSNQQQVSVGVIDFTSYGLTSGGILGYSTPTITTNVTTSNLTEGANLYFTNARAQAAFTAVLPINLISGVISIGYNTSNLKLTSNQLDTVQDIATSSSPQFARLSSSSIGSQNVICGTNTGYGFTGSRCVLIGDGIMTISNSVSQTVAIGSSALSNSTGSYNVAVGTSAGFYLTTGASNILIGTGAGNGTNYLTTGSSNIYLGSAAVPSLNSATGEIVIGNGAGAGSNTAKIYASNGLYVSNLTSGVLKATAGVITSNVTIADLLTATLPLSITSGVLSLGYNSTNLKLTSNQLNTIQNISTTSGPQFARLASSSLGSQNVLCGDNAGASITTGSYNVAMGSSALQSCSTGSNNLAIGFQALVNCTNSNNVAFGNIAGYALVGGSNNIMMGNSAGMGGTPITGGVYCCYIGAGSYPSAASNTREIVIGAMTGNGSNTCSIYAPSGLYVSNLTTGVLKATASQITSNATTTDLTEGTNLYYTSARSRANISGGIGISYNSTSGVITNSGVVGLVAGTAIAVTAGLNGSYTLDNSGVTSLMGTANRVTVSATTGAITLTTPQDIATSSSPQFARILNSSINSTNILIGTGSGQSLTTGGGNTLVGTSAGNAITSGTLNIGIGTGTYGGSGSMTSSNAYNIAVGVNALYSCSTTANNNVAIGPNALISMTTGTYNMQIGNGASNILDTGSYNIHIGQNTTASSSSVSNEGVISLTSATATGKGANTMFINATAGLISYSPAYCTLVSTSFTSGPLVQWAFYNDGTTTYNQGFSLYNTNTLIVQPFAGLYEFTITANMLNTTNYCQVSYIVTNIGTTNLAFVSPAVPSYLNCATGCAQYRPYVSSTPTSTGIGIYLNGGNHYGPYPARMTIRFIGL